MDDIQPTDDLHGAVTQAAANPEDQKSGVRREVGDLTEERTALVKKRIDAVKRARKFWKPDFDRMRYCQDFLLGKQWDKTTDIDVEDRYVANITQRHVQQRTAAVYAKNPTVVARRRETLDFMIWDENPLTAQMALQAVQTQNQVMGAAQSGDPQAQQQAQMAMNPQTMQEIQLANLLLADIHQGMQSRASADRVCKTIQLYFKNKLLAQQHPPFKASMKQLARRTMAAGVGYGKISLVREMEMTPDVLKGMATLQEQMATIENMMANFVDKGWETTELAAEKEQIRLALDGLHKQPEVVSQEGIMFDFPTATSIIPDENLVMLQGFVGCDTVTEEYLLSEEQIQKIWKVDIGKECTKYNPESSDQIVGPVNEKDKGKNKGVCCVWQMYDRTDGLVYTMCDGYKDFLCDPVPPALTLERFFPWFVLGFNYIEHHTQRFPFSDVFLLMHPQREYNRARQGKREHRIANRPMTAVGKGMLDPEDIEKLQTRPPNGVVQLNALAPGQKVDDLLQVVKHPPMDPQVYDTNESFSDVLRVVGSQEANLGGTSNSTATESSIAESSRMSSLQSNMDDMDDFLTEMMRAAGQAVLLEIGEDEVKKVVGRGAAWPKLSPQDAANEYFVEVAAGSSGRPNKSVEIQNLTQVAPIILQIPGINPQWFAREMLVRLDDRLDLTDAFLAGQPSIQALNAIMAKPLGQPGDGTVDPNAQGAEGANNATAPTGSGGALGAQPANAAPPVASAPVPMG